MFDLLLSLGLLALFLPEHPHYYPSPRTALLCLIILQILIFTILPFLICLHLYPTSLSLFDFLSSCFFQLLFLPSSYSQLSNFSSTVSHSPFAFNFFPLFYPAINSSCFYAPHFFLNLFISSHCFLFYHLSCLVWLLFPSWALPASFLSFPSP